VLCLSLPPPPSCYFLYTPKIYFITQTILLNRKAGNVSSLRTTFTSICDAKIIFSLVSFFIVLFESGIEQKIERNLRHAASVPCLCYLEQTSTQSFSLPQPENSCITKLTVRDSPSASFIICRPL